MNYYLPNETGVPNSRSGHPVQPDPRTQGFSNGMYQPQQQQPGGGTNDFFNSVIDEIAQLRMPLDTKNSHSLPNIPYAQGRQSAPPTGLRQNTLMNFANSGSNLSTPIPQSQTSPVYDSFNNVQIRTPSFGNTQINPTMDLSPPGPIDALISLELQNFYNNNTNNYRRQSSLFMENSVSVNNMTPTAQHQGDASFLRSSSTSTMPPGTAHYGNNTPLNNHFSIQNTSSSFPSFGGQQNETYLQNSDMNLLRLSDLQLSDNGVPMVNNDIGNREVPVHAGTTVDFQDLPQQYHQDSNSHETANLSTIAVKNDEEKSAKKSSTVSTPRTPLSASHSHSNYLSDLAIESLQRQRNQSKLIHLDPIPDFQDRKEIKPWLQRIFYPLGIEIVIERSDATKVIFKCKALKKADIVSDATGLQNMNSKTKEQVKESSMSPATSKNYPLPKAQPKKYKRTVSLYNQCPFRIRATLSVKRQKWNIVVVNNGHSHSLKFNSDSDDYRKFKQHLKDMEDWETVKKFDELEYRTKSNLPTNLTTIPCECGLTEEVISFNVVLPSTMTGGLLHNLKSNHHNTHSENAQSPATSLGSGVQKKKRGRKPGSTNKPKGPKSLQQQIGKRKSLETQLDTFIKVEQFLNNNEHHGGNRQDVMGLAATGLHNTPLQDQTIQQQPLLQHSMPETNTQFPEMLDSSTQFDVSRDLPVMAPYSSDNMGFEVRNQTQDFEAPVNDNLFNANEIDFTELFLKPSAVPSFQQPQLQHMPQQYPPSTKLATNKSKKSSGLPQFKHLSRNNAPSNADFHNDISSGTTEPGNTINHQDTAVKPQQSSVGDLLIKELDEMQLLDNERYLLPSPVDYNQSPATDQHDV